MAAKPVNGRLLLLAPASTWRAGWVLVSVSGAVPRRRLFLGRGAGARVLIAEDAASPGRGRASTGRSTAFLAAEAGDRQARAGDA